MLTSIMRPGLLALFVFLNVAVCVMVASAQSTQFTYQGSLNDNGAPANGNYDFEFALFSTISGGSQIGSTLPRNGVPVANGSLSVDLDFGDLFPGADRYLEIRVRPTGQSALTPLVPRRLISSVPYSVKTLNADNATTATTAGNVSGVVSITNGGTGSSTQNFVDLSTNQSIGGDKTFTGSISGVGSGLTDLNGANIIPNSVAASALAPDVLPNARNLSLLGSRRWDLLMPRYAVGSNPQGIAFDGANMWVANSGSNNVTKLRASDGAVLGTYPVGTSPKGVEVDGPNVWVANSGSNNVTKLRASDGAQQGTFATGTAPSWMIFDGTNVWVTNSGSNNVTKLRASDGALQGTYAVGASPQGITFDGKNIWVSSFGGTSITKLRAVDGASLATVFMAVNSYGMTFDGGFVLISVPTPNASTSSVSRVRITNDQYYTGPTSYGTGQRGIVFDGTNYWIANSGTGNVTKFTFREYGNTNTLSVSFLVDSGPTGLAFDGANVWVTCSGSNNVVKLPAFDEL